MARFNFYLREKSKDKETPILLFISFNGKRLKYSIEKSIHPKFWNEDKQLARVVKDFPLAKIFNEDLENIKAEAKKALAGLERDLTRYPSTQELKSKIDSVLNKGVVPENESNDSVPTFLELFKRFIKESEDGTRLATTGKRFDRGTIQKYNTVYVTLQRFSEKFFLSFDTIGKDFYSKFTGYLNREISKTVNGSKEIIKPSYTVNTVGKYIQVIKTFMAYATENGYNSNLYFQSKQFKAHNTPGFSIYLNEDEINQIYELDLSKTPHLERVRDLFIVGCWTGLRFSDFTAIKPENVKGEFLEIKTFKTGEKVIIPIHPIIYSIMAKYEGQYPNSLPPAISNQKMNAYLKEIAKQVDCLKESVEVERIKGGFKTTTRQNKWELVTTHTARRSFATNVYKSGFPAISLMKITGHRTEKSFLLYIKVTPEENAKLLLDHWRKSVLKVG
ncbi:site-specific integrase [Cyclobacterium amurskyense]|uniref:Integrase family protein n=1 Tax=Cyclobacterium amurskyense TaxID=320787 RepID=A0A0H4PR41_9BACT|nr:site-specific integrase [Cyclobacterium amurskyense]AKP50747.1 Integrase family protein [Cyclobacterium amurskyense]